MIYSVHRFSSIKKEDLIEVAKSINKIKKENHIRKSINEREDELLDLLIPESNE